MSHIAAIYLHQVVSRLSLFSETSALFYCGCLKGSTFMISAVPDKPNISYAKCEHDKLTINWTYDHDGGKRVKSITIEYKKNIDNTWNKIQVSKALKQYTISALQPETLYIFRVAIRNEIGESEFSDPYEAETTKKGTKVSFSSLLLFVFLLLCVFVCLFFFAFVFFIFVCDVK